MEQITEQYTALDAAKRHARPIRVVEFDFTNREISPITKRCYKHLGSALRYIRTRQIERADHPQKGMMRDLRFDVLRDGEPVIDRLIPIDELHQDCLFTS